MTQDRGDFWTPIDCLELEGGARLTRIKARVEDPFQLVGMNALGLPGASIDGILGFTILARFRLEIDLTKDRMIWTRLDHCSHVIRQLQSTTQVNNEIHL